MKMNMKFTVVARCRVYEDDKSYTEDLEFTLDKNQAAMFLFRFCQNPFAIGEYKIMLKENNGTLNAITFTDNERKRYIVTNMNQFISNIHEGYFRILAMDKISSIIEFDFDQTYNEDIEDEFK